MLRSIYSLIQRIIDCSDKKYSNTKSKAVLYRFTNPFDQSEDMNPNARRPQSPYLQSLQQREAQHIEAAPGDVGNDLVPKDSKNESSRVTYTSSKDKSSDEITSEMDLEVQPSFRELIESRSGKRVKIASKGPDQISLLLEQIQKMKTGLERLQEIALEFNRSESFTEDINYLIENIGPHLQQQSRSDDSSNDLSTKM